MSALPVASSLHSPGASIDDDVAYFTRYFQVPEHDYRNFEPPRSYFESLPVCLETVLALDQHIKADPHQSSFPSVLTKVFVGCYQHNGSNSNEMVTHMLTTMFVRCCYHTGDDRDELIAYMLDRYDQLGASNDRKHCNRLAPIICQMLNNERYQTFLFGLADHLETGYQFEILDQIMISQTIMHTTNRDKLSDRAIHYLGEKARYLVSKISDDRCEVLLYRWTYYAARTNNAMDVPLQVLPNYFAHLLTGAPDYYLAIAPEWSKRPLLIALLNNMIQQMSPEHQRKKPYFSAFRSVLIERLAEYPQNYQQLACMRSSRHFSDIIHNIIACYEQGSIVMNTDGLFSLAWKSGLWTVAIMRIDMLACSCVQKNYYEMIVGPEKAFADPVSLKNVLEILTECPCYCRDRRHPEKKPLHSGALPIDRQDHALLATAIDRYRDRSASIEILKVLAAYTRENNMRVHYYLAEEMILMTHRPTATIAEMDQRLLHIRPSPDRHYLTTTYLNRPMTGVSITAEKITHDQIMSAYRHICKKND